MALVVVQHPEVPTMVLCHADDTEVLAWKRGWNAPKCSVAFFGADREASPRRGGGFNAPESGQVFAVGQPSAGARRRARLDRMIVEPPCVGATYAGPRACRRQEAIFAQSLRRGSKGRTSACLGHCGHFVEIMVKATSWGDWLSF